MIDLKHIAGKIILFQNSSSCFLWEINFHIFIIVDYKSSYTYQNLGKTLAFPLPLGNLRLSLTLSFLYLIESLVKLCEKNFREFFTMICFQVFTAWLMDVLFLVVFFSNFIIMYMCKPLPCWNQKWLAPSQARLI